MSEHLKEQEPAVKRALTAEQKQELIEKLSYPWGCVDLLCDGHKISLHVECLKALNYCVVVYVDGRWCGKWISANKEFPEQKFMRKQVKKAYSGKLAKDLEKIYGKRAWAKDPRSSETYTQYHPWFSTGRAAINHLCKVCDSVEIWKEPVAVEDVNHEGAKDTKGEE